YPSTPRAAGRMSAAPEPADRADNDYEHKFPPNSRARVIRGQEDRRLAGDDRSAYGRPVPAEIGRERQVERGNEGQQLDDARLEQGSGFEDSKSEIPKGNDRHARVKRA